MTPSCVLSQIPKEKNQHKDCREHLAYFSPWFTLQRIELAASSDDGRVADILGEYHRRNITDKKLISKLLLAEHGIHMRYVYLFLAC